jgi:hypothetical protein
MAGTIKNFYDTAVKTTFIEGVVKYGDIRLAAGKDGDREVV